MKSRSIPYSKVGNCSRKIKKFVWRGHNGAEEYGKNSLLRILCRSHTPFEIWSASRALSPSGLISSSFKCPRYTIEYNVFSPFFHEFLSLAKGCVSPLNWDDCLWVAVPCKRWLWTRNVREVRHHAWRPRMVTGSHSRGCTQCTDLGESGLKSHDTGLEPVLHKIGNICLVRVTIIWVFLAPLECRCSSSSSLAGDLGCCLAGTARKTGCLAPSACVHAPWSPCPCCSY